MHAWDNEQAQYIARADGSKAKSRRYFGGDRRMMPRGPKSWKWMNDVASIWRSESDDIRSKNLKNLESGIACLHEWAMTSND